MCFKKSLGCTGCTKIFKTAAKAHNHVKKNHGSAESVVIIQNPSIWLIISSLIICTTLLGYFMFYFAGS
jgi:hypothetical protein